MDIPGQNYTVSEQPGFLTVRKKKVSIQTTLGIFESCSYYLTCTP